MFQKLSSAELADNTRWEERNAPEPLAIGAHPYDEFIKLGLSSDEAFEGFISFLEKQGARVVKQNASHPFQKRHYLVQAALGDVLKHYAIGGSKPE